MPAFDGPDQKVQRAVSGPRAVVCIGVPKISGPDSKIQIMAQCVIVLWTLLSSDTYWTLGVSVDESDRPPVANGGPDLVVQPQDSVTLNGIRSKDDHSIASYQWQMLTPYPYATIEVSEERGVDFLFKTDSG